MLLNTKKLISCAAILCSGLLLPGCGNDKSPQKEEAETVTPLAESPNAAVVEKAEKIFQNMPSPLQVTALLKQSGARYDQSLLNPPSAVSGYSSNYSRALNLGVYCTDLACANIYDQTQSALGYMDVVTRLSSDIGLASVFKSNDLHSRFKNNIGNRDSLLLIIADLLSETDDFLKQNEKYNTAALIVAGGWIEGMYITSAQASATHNEALITLVGGQKVFLETLLGLLEEYKSDTDFAGLITDLTSLKAAFDKVEVAYTPSEPKTDAVKKITSIGDESRVQISPDQFKELAGLIGVIRTKITKR